MIFTPFTVGNNGRNNNTKSIAIKKEVFKRYRYRKSLWML